MVISLHAPNAALSAELDQVEQDAHDVLTHLSSANDLDEKFPKKELASIAETLVGLNDGGTTAAAAILWYAYKRLPALRRQHVYQDKVADEAQASWRQIRGMTLDKYIVALIASVSTALDECHSQKVIEDELEPNEDLRFSRKVAAQDADRLSDRSRDLSRDVLAAEIELASVRPNESAEIDKLSRGLRDVRGLTEIVATELSFSTVVWTWLQKIGHALSQYPYALETVGKLLQRSADVTSITWLRWGSFWHQVEELIVRQVRELGQDMETLGRKWGKGASPDVTADAPTNSEGGADPDIERMVRVKLAEAEADATSSRIRAVRELIDKDLQHPETVTVLSLRAATDPSREVRRIALAPLVGADAKVHSFVVDELMSAYRKQRVPPGATLSFFCQYEFSADRSVQVRKFLFDVFQTSVDFSQRQTALRALLSKYPQDINIKSAAIDVIKTDSDIRMRSVILGAVTTLHGDDTETRDLLSWVVHASKSPELIARALRIVARHPEWGAWTMPLMLEVRKSGVTASLRREAHRALERIGWRDEKPDNI